MARVNGVLVEIQRAGGRYSGIINNEPVYAKQVKAGQRYEFGDAEISDWLFMRNGKMVGFFHGTGHGVGLEILIFETEGEAQAMAAQMPPGRQVNEFVTVESVEVREVAGWRIGDRMARFHLTPRRGL